ncbi:uncharacterized protein LOC106011345 [Aplysia californica]|uniref:Uncharacterized protein LOC106011345 n=1 Tax=Aplysia californica TaxID=6500 RepID=A0ABM0ZWQ1_APLCA|nr:uncharacterized protein LOC106011345 [Aplysia californica]
MDDRMDLSWSCYLAAVAGAIFMFYWTPLFVNFCLIYEKDRQKPSGHSFVENLSMGVIETDTISGGESFLFKPSSAVATVSLDKEQNETRVKFNIGGNLGNDQNNVDKEEAKDSAQNDANTGNPEEKAGVVQDEVNGEGRFESEAIKKSKGESSKGKLQSVDKPKMATPATEQLGKGLSPKGGKEEGKDPKAKGGKGKVSVGKKGESKGGKVGKGKVSDSGETKKTKTTTVSEGEKKEGESAKETLSKKTGKTGGKKKATKK